MSNELLMRFRRAGIPMDFEMPAWTQCNNGRALAQVELNGARLPNGTNLFANAFRINESSDRSNPDGRGWFVSSDGVPYKPDSLTLDERYGQTDLSLPASVSGSGFAIWKGPVTSLCRVFKGLSGDELTNRLVADYVAYGEVLKAKWPVNTPKLSFHWNVHTLMELHDKNCVTVDNASVSADEFKKFFNLPLTMTSKFEPCRRTNYDLGRIVEALCKGPGCPDSVNMDVDWVGNPTYAREMLEANKRTLAQYGVSMGVDLVNQATTVGRMIGPRQDGLGMLNQSATGRTDNQAAYESQINLGKYLVSSGIYDHRGQALRIQTWNKHAPVEAGAAVAENVTYSAANAANRVFSDVLDVKTIPSGFFTANNNIYLATVSSYCSYENETEWQKVTGRTSLNGITRYGDVPSEMKFDGLCRLADGFFSSKGSIYAGNSQYHYCRLETKAQATLSGAPAKIPEIYPIPSTRIFDGDCWLPNTIFLFGGGIYNSNGVGHYCKIDTMANFTRITKRKNTVGLPTLSLPKTMTNDGVCK